MQLARQCLTIQLQTNQFLKHSLDDADLAEQMRSHEINRL